MWQLAINMKWNVELKWVTCVNLDADANLRIDNLALKAQLQSSVFSDYLEFKVHWGLMKIDKTMQRQNKVEPILLSLPVAWS